MLITRRRRLSSIGVIAFLLAATGTATLAPQASAVRRGGSGWRATATHLRGQNGSLFRYSCPAYHGPLHGPTRRAVYGTVFYTDDSSVCTAAVHAGRITPWRGGTVTIRIRPGRASYRGTVRNGVTGWPFFHSWGGSFVVVRGVAGPSWSATAYGPEVGCTLSRQRTPRPGTACRVRGWRYTYRCAGGGPADRIWGTDVYTSDSSVCTAAVHAGRITLAQGGTVTIVIEQTLRGSYEGTTSNGIKSRGSGPFVSAFVIAGAVPGSWWDASPRYLRGRNGSRFSYSCPAGGKARGVWGADAYTDDSSVCTAAVHAGRITLAQGGTVTIEIRRGQATYRGTTRHGVRSRRRTRAGGSFVFV